MLNEELKIKIIQYLDGELDQGAENEIEEILDSNEKANDFCNQMKSLNINLKEFAHTSEYQAYSKKADALIDTIVEKHLDSKNKSYTFSFKDFLTPQNITGYALTAALFLSVGIFYDESNYENETIFDLNETLYEKTILKTRSISDEYKIKEILSDSVSEMIEAKSSEAQIIHGTDSYLIYLTSKTAEIDGLYCYYGKIYSKGEQTKIAYCISENDSSLIYIN